MIIIAIATDSPGPLTFSLSRIAASECALALDRASERTRITKVKNDIQDILSYGRETVWGTGYREVCELTVEYLSDLACSTRILLLGGTPSGSPESTNPLAHRGLDEDELRQYRRNKKLHSLISISIKGRKPILLGRQKLAEVISGRDLPSGFEIGEGEALGILPLENRGIRQGLIIFNCSARYADRPESKDILAIFANRAAGSIATAREYERSLVHARIEESDASRAKILQQSMIPRFRRSGRIVFWSHLHAAGDLAGDVIIVKTSGDGGMCVWTADVSGRGRSAGWSMMLVRQLLADFCDSAREPGEIAGLINERLYTVEESDVSQTMFACVIGLDVLEVPRIAKFVRAGAPGVYRISCSGDVELFNPNGFPLGIFADASLELVDIPFEPADKLVWASDGLLSSMNENGQHWGTERLLKVLTDFQFLPPRALFEEILAQLGEFGVEDDPRDDRSLLVIGCTPDPGWSCTMEGGKRHKLHDECLGKLESYGLSQGDFTSLRIILDESIKNAHEHGNRSDPKATIEVKISRTEKYIHLAVRDEGGKLNEKVTNPSLKAGKILEDKGRGFLLMRHQADYLWVENDIGEFNAVRLLEAES